MGGEGVSWGGLTDRLVFLDLGGRGGEESVR